MANILETIDAICNDKVFEPADNFMRIKRIAKGYAPMLTQILEDYIRQNEGDTTYRKGRIKAAKRMPPQRREGREKLFDRERHRESAPGLALL